MVPMQEFQVRSIASEHIMHIPQRKEVGGPRSCLNPRLRRNKTVNVATTARTIPAIRFSVAIVILVRLQERNATLAELNEARQQLAALQDSLIRARQAERERAQALEEAYTELERAKFELNSVSRVNSFTLRCNSQLRYPVSSRCL